MIEFKKLDLSDVKRIAAAAEAEAIARGVKVCIAICDDGGHALWFQRMDGASLLSVSLAPSKARMAAVSGRPSKLFQDLVDGGGSVVDVGARRRCHVAGWCASTHR